MYIVKINKPQYEYDIHSLVKAFFPEEEVKVLSPASVIKDRKILETKPALEIFFEEKGVRLLEKGLESPGIEGGERFSDKKVHKAEEASEKESYRGVTEKDDFKIFLYQFLSRHTGKKLPWGNLTGIRPTKIAMTMLEEGKGEEEIACFLRERHFVSEDKITLAIDIAKREKEILERISGTGSRQKSRSMDGNSGYSQDGYSQTGYSQDGYSLYIGIPFCPTTCLYCSFTSYPICSWKDRIGDYLTALEKEIDFTANIYRDKRLDTIYIGGGTPTTLLPEELERLFRKIESRFDLSFLKEFTVETGRADSITAEKLEVLKRHHVTRISVNPQTMKDETLRLIGRQHTVAQVKDAFYLAREMGFDNINMDMILGLPEETEEDVAATIEEIKALSPDSLTVHSLAIKRASRLREWTEKNGISSLHNTDEIMKIAAAGAEALSMKPYYLYRQKNMSGNFENVGYAREGKYGLYNILIMEEVQTIVALGAGTITKRVWSDGNGGVMIKRCDNVKDAALYIEKIDEMIERKRALLT